MDWGRELAERELEVMGPDALGVGGIEVFARELRWSALLPWRWPEPWFTLSAVGVGLVVFFLVVIGLVAL